MAEKNASDIFVSAGAPISIKIHGNCIPINQQTMDPATIQKMAYEMLTPEQISRFEAERELNLSIGIAEVGNFRINLFWQRGSIGVVVRYITSDIPKIEDLALPSVLSDIIMAKRGLVLVVGATGSGKSTTIAAMLDHRNTNRSGHILTVEDPIEFLFKHKKSMVNQREVGLDTHSWGEALKNAMRQAPDCILIGEIRDKETMSAAIVVCADRPPLPGDPARQQCLPCPEPHHQFLPAGKPDLPLPRFIVHPEDHHFPAPGAPARRQAPALRWRYCSIPGTSPN